MKIALFDFDGTITQHDTFLTFGKIAKGKWGVYHGVLKWFPWLIAWKLKLITNSEAKERLFRTLFHNMSVEEFQSYCEEFRSVIDADLRKETLEIIKKHKADGAKIVIVSASIADWIRPWAERNGIDRVIATEIEKTSVGLLSGNFASRNCHGPEKVNRIKESLCLSPEDEIWAYGDSSGDSEMLKFADHGMFL